MSMWRPASVIQRVELVPPLDAARCFSPGDRAGGALRGGVPGHPWVYVAVTGSRSGGAGAVSQWRGAATKRGRAGPITPLSACCRSPSPLLSRFELIEHTVGHLEVHGNAYWFPGRGAGRSAAGVWPLRPDRVSVVPDARRGVRGYVYEVRGDGFRWTRRGGALPALAPGNDYYGLSALEAARLAVEGGPGDGPTEPALFRRGMAVPAGIVAIRERISDTDYERLQREWRSAYGGRERRTRFCAGRRSRGHSVGLSQQDMDFLNARRFNREEIFQIFGPSRSGCSARMRLRPTRWSGSGCSCERTLWPKLVRIAEKITTDLLPFYGMI